jgi:hypothetical protein
LGITGGAESPADPASVEVHVVESSLVLRSKGEDRGYELEVELFLEGADTAVGLSVGAANVESPIHWKNRCRAKGRGSSTIVHCRHFSLDADDLAPERGTALSLGKLSPGTYSLRVYVGSAKSPQLVEELPIELVEVPVRGERTRLVVAPASRPNALSFTGSSAVAWVNVDGRQFTKLRTMSLLWFRDGELVHEQHTKFAPRVGPHMGGPVVDTLPMYLELPADLEGDWTVVATDADLPLASWRFSVAQGQLSGDDALAVGAGKGPMGIVKGTRKVPDELLDEAKKRARRGNTMPEHVVCVLAFAPEGPSLIARRKGIMDRIEGLKQTGSYVAASRKDTAVQKAVRQGYVSKDGKYAFVPRIDLVRARAAGARAQAKADREIAKLKPEVKALNQDFDALAEEYGGEGCIDRELAKRSAGRAP